MRLATLAQLALIRQLVALLAAPLEVAAQRFQAPLQVAHPILGTLGVVGGLTIRLVEMLPALLRVLIGCLGLVEARLELGQRLGGLLLLGAQGLQALVESRQAFGVGLAEFVEFAEFAAGGFELAGQLLLLVAGVFEALLEPGDRRAGLVEARLMGLELFGQAVVFLARLFEPTLALALAEDLALDLGLQLAHAMFLLALPGAQRTAAQQRQLALEAMFLLLEGLVASRCLGLALQAFELPVELLANVVEALEVLLGAAHAVFGLAAPLLVLGDAGGLLQRRAQLLGTRLDQPRDHALADDRVGARPQPGAHEQIGDVAAPALLAVEEVARLAVAGDHALDADLGVLGIGPAHAAVAIVEQQFDRGLAHRLAPGGTVEDHVGHRLAAQRLRRGFAHHPAHRVDDVGLAAAVGSNDRRHAAVERHAHGVDERLEAGQLDRFETHAGVGFPRRQRSTGESTELPGRAQAVILCPSADAATAGDECWSRAFARLAGLAMMRIAVGAGSCLQGSGFVPTASHSRERVMQHATPHYLQRQPNLPLNDGAWEAIDATDLVEIPLLGQVAAGLPIEACPDTSTVSIPSRMVRRNTYALRVRGNSMIDCNIFDGDVIIIERQESAENGETAVVMINDKEVTLKKLYIDKSGVRLQPANASMPPIYLKNDDVQVLGLVMGVMRQPSIAA